jgi:hypothetical protein
MKKQKGTECPLIVVDKGVFDSIVRLQVAMDRETDGRFFAEIMELPGVMSYGNRWRMRCFVFRHWRFESLPTGWITVKQALS